MRAISSLANRGSSHARLRDPVGGPVAEVPYGGRLTEGLGMVLTINLAFLLTVIVVLRLRRRTQARSHTDEQMSAVIVLVLGVLIAPTKFGHWILDTVGQLAHNVSQIHI